MSDRYKIHIKSGVGELFQVHFRYGFTRASYKMSKDKSLRFSCIVFMSTMMGILGKLNVISMNHANNDNFCLIWMKNIFRQCRNAVAGIRAAKNALPTNQIFEDNED